MSTTQQKFQTTGKSQKKPKPQKKLHRKTLLK